MTNQRTNDARKPIYSAELRITEWPEDRERQGATRFNVQVRVNQDVRLSMQAANIRDALAAAGMMMDQYREIVTGDYK